LKERVRGISIRDKWKKVSILQIKGKSDVFHHNFISVPYFLTFQTGEIGYLSLISLSAISLLYFTQTKHISLSFISLKPNKMVMPKFTI